MKKEIKSGQEEIKSTVSTIQEKMDAWIAEMGAWQKETIACQELTEACLEGKKPTSLEAESITVHEEVPKKKAAVNPIGTLKKRHGDWHLAVRQHGQPKK
jgi:hypothetical protein